MILSENIKTKKVIKAGMWYTISNFLIRALSLISTPIFARLLSVNEFGEYSNFISWMTILTILTTMDLHSTINRARFDFKDDVDGYISSITITSLIIPSIFYLITVIFMDFFRNFLSMKDFYIHLMYLSIIFSSALNIFQAKQRIDYEYKKSVIVAFLTSILTVFVSILLVLLMNNKLNGRIIGQTFPAIFVNICLAFFLIKKGKKFNYDYAKYAVTICLPYIPHLLAMNILSQYDRIQINKICGPTFTALYSMAYSCALIINIFLNSLNNAWSPWLGEKLNEKKYLDIKTASRKYLLIFLAIGILIFFITPEILLIIGGKKYSTAIYVMPPIIAGSIFQFIYTLYVNIEMFEKKVWRVALATGVAAIINIFLNQIFIEKYGYIAAAFTTMFCYMILCLFHYLNVKRLKLTMVYDTKFIILVMLATLLLMVVTYLIYDNYIVRYILILIYIIFAILFVKKNKTNILLILKK